MKAWYSIKEQCAGKYRLLFLWYVYKVFRLKGLKIFLYPIVFVIYLASKNGRKASQTYRKVLYVYQTQHGIKPTKFSSFGHIFSYAFSFAEKMSALCDKKCPLRFEVEENEDWTSFQQDINKGLFLISSHLGNIEALPALPAYFKIKETPTVNALMEINQNSIFHQFIKEKTTNSRFCLLPADAFGFVEIMQLYEKISAGEIILMAADRVSSQNPKNTLSAQMLDKECSLPVGVFRFAKKMDHPTYTLLLLRTKKDAYRLFVQKIDLQKSTDNMAKQYLSFVQKHLLEYPEQWYNFFDFFK